MNLSDPHHFRKTVAGMCMVAAPALLLVGTVVHPDSKTDEAAQMAVIADHLDAWYIAHLLLLVSLVLAVPAVLGLMHMLREREVAYGHIGGGLAMLGLMAYVGIVAMEMVLWQMGTSGDRGAMVAVLRSLNDTAGIVIPFFVVSAGFALGMICLAAGLYRARAVQWWMAICLVVAAVCIAVATFAAANWLAIVGAAILFVSLGSIGRMVLTESDEDWEHTPEYKGFRPMLGT
jgi:hypothetical protein